MAWQHQREKLHSDPLQEFWSASTQARPEHLPVPLQMSYSTPTQACAEHLPNRPLFLVSHWTSLTVSTTPQERQTFWWPSSCSRCKQVSNRLASVVISSCTSRKPFWVVFRSLSSCLLWLGDRSCAWSEMKDCMSKAVVSSCTLVCVKSLSTSWGKSSTSCHGR